jgi:uncharacterized protein YbjT (DUF2867 family)
MEKTALIFGGSGLVGRSLINELEKKEDYSSLVVFTRKSIDIESTKAKKVITDFDNLSSISSKLKGDEVFICLGTTIKKAGSIEKMEQIDRDLPLLIAKLAHEAGVSRIAIISSIGANEKSRSYYLRIKGEMEHGLRDFDFENIVIVRPSILFGARNEQRLGEKLGKIVIKTLGFLLVGKLRKYRGIHARTVALAMINILEQDLQEIIYESDELHELGKL